MRSTAVGDVVRHKVSRLPTREESQGPVAADAPREGTQIPAFEAQRAEDFQHLAWWRRFPHEDAGDVHGAGCKALVPCHEGATAGLAQTKDRRV